MKANTTAVRSELEAEPEDVGISSERIKRLSEKAQQYVDEGRLPGVITMVARRGKIVHFETCGSMDDEAGKPMAADTIFRIYSMTKPIVSVALMMLYEEGKFQLGDPVSKYVPELKDLKVFAGGTAEKYETRDAAREMTVRDVLSHMSGLGSPSLGAAPPLHEIGRLYGIAGVPGIGHKGTLHDTMVKLGQLPLQVDPGTQWIYGVSTDVVAYLVEVLSGMPLDRFLEERIYAPLGMVDTHWRVPASKIERFAANYTFKPDGPGYRLMDAPATSEFANESNTYFSGVGGLTSTASDYMRFAKMLANLGELDGARILGPRTLELMTLNHLPGGVDRAAISQPFPGLAQQWGTGFGLGFGVLLDPAAAQIVGTPGEFYWSGAASTHFFVSPSDELAVVFMTQYFGRGPADGIGADVRIATYQALID